MIINMHITHSLESNLISNGEEYYPMTVISRCGEFNTKTVVIQNVSASQRILDCILFQSGTSQLPVDDIFYFIMVTYV